jgi:polysaccharide export outer membrane protein
MRTNAWVVLLLGAIVLVSGCVPVPVLKPDFEGMSHVQPKPPQPGEPPFPSAIELVGQSGPGGASGRPVYRVGPTDELIVTVWGRPDLGSQIPVGQLGELRASRIREDGTLILPFLEPLAVSGKTLAEIRDMVQAAYAKVVEKPQVEVKLHTCVAHSVQVSGEVARPGTVRLCTDRVTVGEVLSEFGAVLPTADLSRGILTRNGKAYRLSYRGNENGMGGLADIALQDEDVIFFPRLDENVVYVFGEVVHQGTYPIPIQGMTLLEALGRANGPISYDYQTGGIFLIRNEQNDLVVYKLGMAEILQGPSLTLTNGDRVFVALSGLSRWDRFWRKALPVGIFRTTVTVTPQ